MVFRTLTAREIDCRAQQIKQNGLILLLYKDARCDMSILDETVGPTNWQRHHCRDNANCIVSIWDPEKKEWISKEDTGTESNTEAQKGLASDSFKRACTNWGIGRELYTAPFIWVPSDKAEIKSKGKDKMGRDIFTCNDPFAVSDIGYNEHREINRLVIVNEKTNKPVFSFGSSRPVPAPSPAPKPSNGRIPTNDDMAQVQLIVKAIHDAASANTALSRISEMDVIPEAKADFGKMVTSEAKKYGLKYSKSANGFIQG